MQQRKELCTLNIKCSKDDLLNGVNIVTKAVSTRSTLPILQCILVQATNDGLKLVGNDLELGIESQINATIIETGSVSLEAKIFSDIVRKLPDNDITISVNENNLTTIICEKSKFTISGHPGSEFIQLPEVNKNQKFSLSQFKLKEMIGQTIFSIALEEIRPIFTGELIEVKDHVLSMVSVDGYRVSIRNIEVKEDIEDFKVIIPGKTLNEIYKILSNDDDNDVSIYYTDKHVLFEIQESIVVSRLLEGEFPNYNNMFSKDYETLVKINRRDLIMSLDRASLIAKESKKNPIKISITENSMVITSNTDLGNVYEELDIHREGIDLDIAFNPKYLIEALKVIDDEEVDFLFTSALNPCIIRKVEKEDYKYLVLPIRMN
jgi:DNA polymerase-3 subunit beta